MILAYTIEPESEELVPLRDVPARIARWTGVDRRPHRSAVYRWVARGLRGVRLPVIAIGGTKYTSTAALSWWARATAAAATDAIPTQGDDSDERAELRAMRILPGGAGR